MRGLRLR